MMTAKDVFDIAINLMDRQDVSDGSTMNVETTSFAQRAPRILDSLFDQCYPASDNFSARRGRRGVTAKIRTLEDPVDLDERICTNVLPYGLAGMLLVENDPETADFFWQTYLENLRDARRDICSGAEEPIEGIPGIEYGQFGHW